MLYVKEKFSDFSSNNHCVQYKSRAVFTNPLNCGPSLAQAMGEY